jgi:predicted aldo/keto reductase-like oxidoreductase
LITAAAPLNQLTAASPKSKSVPMRPFGKTGAKVSILSLGGMFDIASNQLMLKQAMRWGVTYWDTADCYQRGSEKGIGKYFNQIPAETRQKMATADFSEAERRCPQGIAIGRLMIEALNELG